MPEHLDDPWAEYRACDECGSDVCDRCAAAAHLAEEAELEAAIERLREHLRTTHD